MKPVRSFDAKLAKNERSLFRQLLIGTSSQIGQPTVADCQINVDPFGLRFRELDRGNENLLKTKDPKRNT